MKLKAFVLLIVTIAIWNFPFHRPIKNIRKCQARKRVLKAKKNFYARQHENGMLSEESCRVLIAATEQSMELPDVDFSVEKFLKMFQEVRMMEFAREKLFNPFEYAFSVAHAGHMSSCKKKWAYIVVHPLFDVTINFIVLVNVITNIYFLVLPKKEWHLPVFLGLIVFFCSVYIVEMVSKQYVLSIGKRCIGFINYYRSIWNTLDFIFLILTLFEGICVCVDEFHKAMFVISSLAALRLFRIFRMFRRFRYCAPLVTYFPRIYENAVASKAYEIGKTFIKGEQDLMAIIPGMVKDPNITEDILSKMDLNIMEIIRELERIQKNRPQVAVNVKTKHAIRSVLNSMSDEIDHIKVAGWVDELEYKLLMKSIYERYQFLNNLEKVRWSSPKTLFNEIPWLGSNAWLTEYLYVSVQTKNYDSHEYIIVNDELAPGVYIVLSGLLKIEYEPCKQVLEQLEIYGALPVIDYITDTNFAESKRDFIVSGNCFGELSILTGRPYACSIIADSPCQLYFISGDDIRNAMRLDNDVVEGLESRMWKTLCSRLALYLLTRATPYRTTPSDEVRLCLDRCFVPNLRSFSVLKKTENMEDILLIEGIVLDLITHVYYVAPRHLPRTLRNIGLPGNSEYSTSSTVETKLMIITTPNTKADILLEQQHTLDDVYSDSHLIRFEKMRSHRTTLLALARPTINENEIIEDRSQEFQTEDETLKESRSGSDLHK